MTASLRQAAQMALDALTTPLCMCFAGCEACENAPSNEEIAKALQAALAVPDEPVAEGFKLVPLEPTPEMLRAAIMAPLPLVMLDSYSARENLQNTTHYKAMLAAAPQTVLMERQPLTSKQLAECLIAIEDPLFMKDPAAALTQFARAIEAHHGIKGAA